MAIHAVLFDWDGTIVSNDPVLDDQLVADTEHRHLSLSFWAA